MLETSQAVLPNLFIIGAAKSGTTSLHRYLDAHPEICMSEPKEPRLFAEPDWEARLPQYAAMLPAAAAPVRGESSTLYSRYPIVRGVPERIAATAPEARLIYMVRDPVERVLANWVQRYSRREEHRPLAAALSNLDDPRNRYVSASRYATQLEQWLRWFEPERILVIEQDQLRDDRAGTLTRVHRFLGVKPEVPANVGAEFNRSADKRGMTPAAARRWAALRPLTRRLPPRAGQLLSTSPLFPAERIGTPRIEPALRIALEGELRGEAERFRRLTGMAFAGWSI